MPTAVWIHDAADPLSSGELRRLGLAALAMEGEGWRSAFVHADRAALAPDADVAIVPLRALRALPGLSRPPRPPAVVVEIDEGGLEAEPQAEALLRDLKGRIASAVVRSAALRGRVRAALGPDTPVWVIPDIAERTAELRAAALRFDLPWPETQATFPAGEHELWFADAGERVEDIEVDFLAALWRAPGDAPRVAAAPSAVLEWLAQAGVVADVTLAADRLTPAFGEGGVFVAPANDGAGRRRRKAARHGLRSLSADEGETDPAFDPVQVGAAWRARLGGVAAAGMARPARPATVLIFLDLIQDIDLALPLIDSLAGRPELSMRIAVSTWLEERSPRVSALLEDRGLSMQLVEREAVRTAEQPSLEGVDAVVSVVETSDPAHARAHALFRRARARAIPTFSLQHGIENVGLTYFDGGDPEIVSDFVFAWFPPAATPAGARTALRPRLVHTGRPRQEVRGGDLRGVFSAFDRVAAVFENLHWDRYDETYRRRFLDDCAEFALAFPTTAVLIKPHHGGMWIAKNRALFPQWSANLVMADPSDPFWEPFTAPSLIDAADLVITTPSTVALDAALARKPVAVAAYGLDLPAFEPLPMLQSAADWTRFGAEASSTRSAKRRADFLSRAVRSGEAADDAADLIATAARRRATRASGPARLNEAAEQA